MAVTASWSLGMEHPKIVSGAHQGGVPKRWTVQIVASSTDGWIERTTLRPKRICTLHALHDIVLNEIAKFKKEHELATLSWVAVSR